MSVINQMLRDLDARAASENERAGLPPHLRTLPPKDKLQRQNWHMLAIGIAIGIAIGAAVAGGTVALLLQPPAPPTPAFVPTPAPMPTPAVPRSTATESVPPASTSAAAQDKPVKPVDESEMKLSTLLTLAQQSAVEKPAAAKPAAPAPAVPVAPAAPKAPAAAVTAAPAPSAKPAESVRPVAPAAAAKPAAPLRNEVAADAQIDKRPKSGHSNEAVEAEYRKGMQAVKRGDNATGVLAFQRALELDPGMVRARQALLSVLVGGRQWGEAQRVAQAGLALDPTQSGWAMILARLQFEQGDAAGAVETLGRHAAHAQGDADYQGLFAYLLQKQQRPAEAAERFKAALALRPNEGRWWFGLGLALEAAGRGGEAREAYLKARDSGNLPGDMGSVVEQKLH